MEKPKTFHRQFTPKTPPESLQNQQQQKHKSLKINILKNLPEPKENPSLSANTRQPVDFQHVANLTDKLQSFLRKLVAPEFVRYLTMIEQFTKPVIYFGVRRAKDKGKALPVSKQPKDPAKQWYIEYYFYSEITKKKERVRDYGGSIGGFKMDLPLKERVQLITNYRDSLYKLLLSGQYNPFDENPEYIKYKVANRKLENLPDSNKFRVADVQKLSVLNALNWAIENKISKGITVETVRAYNNCLLHWSEGATQIGHIGTNIMKFSPEQFIESMEAARQHRGMSNKRYNTVCENVSSLFKHLNRNLVIPTNPAAFVEKLKEDKGAGYKSPTLPQLREKIVPHLRKHHGGLLNALILFWNLGLRGHDLVHLKVKNIDLKSKRYKIVPEVQLTTKGAVRNKKSNTIKEGPIPDEAVSVLQKMMADSPYAEPEWYVMGHQYKPNDKPMKRDTITTHWRVQVKEGLKIDVDFYGCRHASGKSIIKSKADIESARLHLGHESVEMTMNYVGDEIHSLEEAELLQKLPRLII